MYARFLTKNGSRLALDDFARVHDAIGIEGRLDGLVGCDPWRPDHLSQQVALAGAHAVLAGAGAAHLYRPPAHPQGEVLAGGKLRRIAVRIEQEQGVKVAVADVTKQWTLNTSEKR